MTTGSESMRWSHDVNGVTVSGMIHAGDGERGTIVVAPALGVSATSYHRVGSALAATGFTVLVLQYGWGREAGGSDYSALACRQMPAAVNYARVTSTGPVWIVGHSLGAQAAVLGGLSGDLDADGLVIVAGGVPDHRRYPGLSRWKPMLGTAVAYLVAHVQGCIPAGAPGVAVSVPTALVDEWARWCWTGRPPLGPSADATKPFARATALVLDGDELAPRDCAQALMAMLGAGERNVVETTAGRGHVEWLRSPDAVVEEIVAVISGERPRDIRV